MKIVDLWPKLSPSVMSLHISADTFSVKCCSRRELIVIQAPNLSMEGVSSNKLDASASYRVQKLQCGRDGASEPQFAQRLGHCAE